MTPIGAKHASVVDRLNRLFTRKLPASFIVRVQNPFILNPDSEPQPDLLLLKARADFYATAHPKAKDVVLVIEVSDTTAAYDRLIKLPAYAEAEIPEAWIVDLNQHQLEVYRSPDAGHYLFSQAYKATERVAPLAVPRLSLRIRDFLGNP